MGQADRSCSDEGGWRERAAELARIIRPVPSPAYEAQFPWTRLVPGLEESIDGRRVDLNPDFQRGNVWSDGQQRAWIEAVLRGTVTRSSGLVVQFNAPDYASSLASTGKPSDLPPGMQCLDGLQRITAARRFLAGEIEPFGLHVDQLRDAERFPDRTTTTWRVVVYAYRTRREVLEHYLAFNSGGTVHGESEIERVRALLAST